MITRLQVARFRCLRYVDQNLGRLNVLVGPNASGKTTFLDALEFLGDCVQHGPQRAIQLRTNNPYDLLYCCRGDSFEIGIELQVPKKQQAALTEPYPTVRYE